MSVAIRITGIEKHPDLVRQLDHELAMLSQQRCGDCSEVDRIRRKYTELVAGRNAVLKANSGTARAGRPAIRG